MATLKLTNQEIRESILAEELSWNQTLSKSDPVEVPAEHQTILQDRLAELEANPRDLIEWETFKDALHAPRRR